MRVFRETPLPDGLLRSLLEQAHRAPSVGAAQPWRFVIVDDASRRAAVRASFERANAEALAGYDGERAARYARLKLEGLATAPAHLAVFTDDAPDEGHGLGRRTMPEMLAYSTVCAIQTFWLAARAQGVGVGWVSILEPDIVTKALDAPNGWTLTAYLCVGRPEEESETPALERAGWQARRPLDAVLFRR